MEWKDIWNKEFEKDYFVKLKNWVTERRKTNNVLPDSKNIMTAFKLCPFTKVKIVVVGQDPYPNKDHPHGLAFSSKSPETPGSLKNIFKAIQQQVYPNEKYEDLFKSNDLTSWAEQGILLINRVLTVDEGKSNSHIGIGWETFTDEMLRVLSKYSGGIVFMLWGTKAQEAEQSIENKEEHLILKSVHPSPLSADRGFFDNMHFREAQSFLLDKHFQSVYWFLEDLLVKNEHYLNELKRLYDKTSADLGSDDNFRNYLRYMLRTFAKFPALVNDQMKENLIINFKTK